MASFFKTPLFNTAAQARLMPHPRAGRLFAEEEEPSLGAPSGRAGRLFPEEEAHLIAQGGLAPPASSEESRHIEDARRLAAQEVLGRATSDMGRAPAVGVRVAGRREIVPVDATGQPLSPTAPTASTAVAVPTTAPQFAPQTAAADQRAGRAPVTGTRDATDPRPFGVAPIYWDPVPPTPPQVAPGIAVPQTAPAVPTAYETAPSYMPPQQPAALQQMQGTMLPPEEQVINEPTDKPLGVVF